MVVKLHLHINESMPLSDGLVVATLEDFVKATTPLLIASTAACKHEDTTKKWKVPNKGTVDDVRDLTKRCKKTGLIFLLQYLFEDLSHGTIIHASTGAKVRLWQRYNQHLVASKLTNPRTNKMKLYQTYPHESVTQDIAGRKGTFQSLNHLVCIAVD